MKTKAIFTAMIAGAMATLPAHAQDAVQSDDAASASAATVPVPVPAPAPEPSIPDIKGEQTWYVMISLYESIERNSCGRQLFKVITGDPITVEGPDTITINHINAVVGEWMAYLRDHSPRSYEGIHGATGDHLTDVYFRRSDEEVRRAFRNDGHLAREPGCWGSVLVKQPTQRFQFPVTQEFVRHEFGQEPLPPPGVSGVARDLPAIPGVAARN